MTHAEFRQALHAMHWTARGLARILGHPEGRVLEWSNGRVRVPEDVGAWLLACLQALPPPPVRGDRQPLAGS